MYLILILTFVLIGSALKRDKKQEVVVEWFYFLFLWFFAATSMNGKDRLSYEGIFNSIDPDSSLSLMLSQNVLEKGYYLLNYIVKNFTEHFVIFLIISSFITTVLTFKGFKYFQTKFNLKLELILLVYLPTVYISAQMGALRQSIAIGIFIFSFRYILENKYLKYVLCIIIASLFHISALFLLMLPMIYWFKGNNRLLIIIVSHLGLYYLLSLFSGVLEFGRLSNYAKESVSYGVIGTIERSIFLAMVIIRYKMKGIKETEKILLELYMLYFMQVLVFDSFFAFMYRIKIYYFAVFAILFPILLNNITLNGLRARKVILYVYGIIVGIVFTGSQEVYDYFFPYRNYLFENHTANEVKIIKDVESNYKYIFALNSY